MRSFLTLIVFLATVTAVAAQDRHSWDSLSQLKPGDKVRLSLTRRRPVTGEFQSWTQEQVTVGTVSAKKEDVLKVERYRLGGWGRGKTAAAGAAIGFGGGFAVGAALGGCSKNKFGPCISRGEFGAIVAGIGAVVGALIGAALPHHSKDVIYVK